MDRACPPAQRPRDSFRCVKYMRMMRIRPCAAAKRTSRWLLTRPIDCHCFQGATMEEQRSAPTSTGVFARCLPLYATCVRWREGTHIEVWRALRREDCVHRVRLLAICARCEADDKSGEERDVDPGPHGTALRSGDQPTTKTPPASGRQPAGKRLNANFARGLAQKNARKGKDVRQSLSTPSVLRASTA